MRPLTVLFSLLLTFGLTLGGCDDTDGSTDSGPPAGVDVAKSALERDLAPSVEDAELDELVAGNTAFAFDLYHKLAGKPGNLVFSPHSISAALAMTYAGAESNTETQMADALSFTLPEPALHKAFNALDLLLASRGAGAEGQDGEPFRLRVVNAAWAQRGYEFVPDFLDTLGLNYGAGVNLLDFDAAPEPSREVINGWVSEQTEERIPDLIPEGIIDSQTRLVLTNAVYFNASWKYQFEPTATADADFTLADGTTIQVPTMVQTQSFRAAQQNGITAVELPYDGDEIAIVVMTSDGDFGDFEASLDGALLNAIDAALEVGEIEIHLPKFEYRAKANLREPLVELGMTDAFGNADFSGMDGGRSLVVTDVRHQAFILLDETGTEAAAATAVVVGRTSVPPPPEVVRFDRPFVYFIRDVATGAILFIGRVEDPSA